MKNSEEIIEDAPLLRKALFKGMQYTALVGSAAILVSLIATPASLAVIGSGLALTGVSLAGQLIFLSQERKRQLKEEDIDFLSKKYSPKRNFKDHSKPINEDVLFYKPEYIQMPTQKQVPKVQKSADIKKVTPSVRFSAAELKQIQRSRQQRYHEM